MATKNIAQAFGQYAEEVAADYLVKKGFKVLAQNFRYKRFEIDLIVQKETLIVFVEVKARKNTLFGNPESFVNQKKIRSLRLAAAHYLRIQNSQQPIRFDIVAVLGSQHQVVEIMHLEDGFY
ncbi:MULTISPECIES: YraN family protein [Candidatus Cardinium]|uniref:YraN family protein n=1 Tax=Candidatus Cardinium TaxID=273135 RepID=UPI001FA97BD9|nr:MULTISPECIES: YraN family protein [Cardinium]